MATLDRTETRKRNGSGVPKRVLVVAAFSQELSSFEPRVPCHIETLYTGIGRAKTLAALRKRVLPGHYDLIVSAGFAGAARAAMKTGDLIVASEVIDAESGRRFVPDGLPQGAGLIGLAGRFVTCGRPVASPEEKARIGARFDAAAIEMETSAAAEAAVSSGTRWCALRSILDPMEELLAVGSVGQALRMLAVPARWRDFSHFLGLMHTARNSLAAGLVDLVSGVDTGLSNTEEKGNGSR